MPRILLFAFLFIFSAAGAKTPDELKKQIQSGTEAQRYEAARDLVGYYISFQRTVGDTSMADSARMYFPVLQSTIGKDTSRIVEYNLMLGWFRAKFNILNSFEDIRNAIKAARDHRDKRLIGESYLTAGMLMEKEVDYITGLQYYFAASNYFKLLKDQEKLAFCYSKIGSLLAIYIQYDRALEYLTEASDMFFKTQDLEQYAQTMQRLIPVQLRAGLEKQAFETLDQMENNLKDKPYQKWLVKVYYSIAEFLISAGEAKASEKYLGKAYSLLPQVQEGSVFKLMPFLGFAKLYIQQGESQKAIQYLRFCEKESTLVKMKDAEFLNLVQEMNLAYYSYYVSIGQAQKAADFLAKYNELNIQVQTNLSDKITAMVRVFEAEKEENYTIANLQDLNQQQRLIVERQNTKLNYLIILAALLLFVLAAIYYRYRERQKISKYLETEVESRTQELKAQSQEKTLMLKEIHHRVKNNLQLISSFLNLQKHYSNNDKSTEDIITETQERVRCMAIIHEKLYSAESLSNLDTEAYLSEIAHFVYQSYSNASSNIEVHLNIQSAKLTLDRMIPCGLIINELMSNCFKYAFKGKNEGDIWVDFTTSGEEKHLVIRDNGVGLPPDFSLEKLNSLGMNIVVGLVDQLDGHFDMHTDNGTVFDIRFS